MTQIMNACCHPAAFKIQNSKIKRRWQVTGPRCGHRGAWQCCREEGPLGGPYNHSPVFFFFFSPSGKPEFREACRSLAIPSFLLLHWPSLCLLSVEGFSNLRPKEGTGHNKVGNIMGVKPMGHFESEIMVGLVNKKTISNKKRFPRGGPRHSEHDFKWRPWHLPRPQPLMLLINYILAISISHHNLQSEFFFHLQR